MGLLNDLDVFAAAGVNVATPAAKLHITRTELLDFFLSLLFVFHPFLHYGLQLKLHDLVQREGKQRLESLYAHSSANFTTRSSKNKHTYSIAIFLLTIVFDFFHGLVHQVFAVFVDLLLFRHPRVFHIHHSVSAVLSSSSALNLEKGTQW